MAKVENPKSNGSITRRQMLGTGAVASASLAMTGMAQAAPRPMPESWDEEVDIVIIGTGFAGLAASYEATQAGASVALLEKMPVPGGNSIINGGVISAAGSPQQAEQGIEDSPDVMLADMMKAGLSLNHPQLAQTVAEQSAEIVQWTIDELGVEYRGMMHMGGHAVPRAYATAAGSGSGIVIPQLEKLKELGVEPRTNTLLKHLIRDGNGRVKGVEVHEGYRFPDAESGDPKLIMARRAVVLATGGFGNDVAYRMVQDPRLTDELDTTNQPGATSEALREALNIGATLVQPSWIQLGPWTSPDERGFGVAPYFVQGVTAAYGLWIETTSGQRFVNELADRKTRADAIIAAGNNVIAFCDAGGLEKAKTSPGVKLDRLFESGVLKEYATLAEMADAYDIPLAPLQDTIASFNASVAAGEDSEMGRYIQADQFPIEAAPYYAVRLLPKIHHTMGGLGINTEAQALDVVTGEPIAGLYAAGEATGGVHGASRLGSCAIADCLVFGRIAGRNAAAEESWV